MPKGAVAAVFAASAGLFVVVKKVKRRGKPRRLKLILPTMYVVGLYDVWDNIFRDTGSMSGFPTWPNGWINVDIDWSDAVGFIVGTVLSIIEFATGPIVDLVRAQFNRVINHANFLKYISDAVDWAVKDARKLINNTIDALFRDIWEIISSAVEAWWEPFSAMLSYAYDTALNFGENVYQIARDVALAAARGILGEFMEALMDALHLVQGFLDDPVGFIRDIVNDALDGIVDMIVSIITSSIAICASIVRFGLEALLDVGDDVIDILQKAWHVIRWVALHPEEVIEELVRQAIQQVVNSAYDIVREEVNNNFQSYENDIRALLGL